MGQNLRHDPACHDRWGVSGAGGAKWSACREAPGQAASLAEIYEAARELQKAYSSAYPLARITVSPHDVRGGDVRITVTDGHIEKLDLSGVPERVRDLVRARLEQLVGKSHLTAEEFQRRTILIGTLAGVTGTARLDPTFRRALILWWSRSRSRWSKVRC